MNENHEDPKTLFHVEKLEVKEVGNKDELHITVKLDGKCMCGEPDCKMPMLVKYVAAQLATGKFIRKHFSSGQEAANFVLAISAAMDSSEVENTSKQPMMKSADA